VLGEDDILDRKYHLDRLIGEGGMGAVYLATHVILEKRVAIKLLHPQLSETAETLERFYREARARRVPSREAVAPRGGPARTGGAPPGGNARLPGSRLDVEPLWAIGGVP